VHGHHAGIVGNLAPALRFLKGAAGKTTPLRRIGNNLDGILVAFGGIAHEGRGDFRLLHEILWRASAKINDSAGGRVPSEVRGLENIANNIGYDQGALGFRAAGTVDVPGGAQGYQQYNYVQGLNGPVGFNNHLAGTNAQGAYSTYYVTPPRTYGVEFHYKFY